MPVLRYNGPLPFAQVVGFGHFSPGDEKQVDLMTAVAFQSTECKSEGWEVVIEPVAEGISEAPVDTQPDYE